MPTAPPLASDGHLHDEPSPPRGDSADAGLGSRGGTIRVPHVLSVRSLSQVRHLAARLVAVVAMVDDHAVGDGAVLPLPSVAVGAHSFAAHRHVPIPLGVSGAGPDEALAPPLRAGQEALLGVENVVPPAERVAVLAEACVMHVAPGARLH